SDLRPVDVLPPLLASASVPSVVSKNVEKEEGNAGPADAERVQKALTFIKADDYFRWVQVGMALKHDLGDAGFALWDEWSKTAPDKYAENKGNSGLEAKWRSFRQRRKPIRTATIFFWARQAGWKGGPPQFSDEALALRFAAEHRADLRYVDVWGYW